jgi:hypothetical protein
LKIIFYQYNYNISFFLLPFTLKNVNGLIKINIKFIVFLV